MKKIKSLFKKNYDTRLAYNEINKEAEWVLSGKGWATEKFDGTACMIKDGLFYKRYDRKLIKSKKNPNNVSYKPAPDKWIACERLPDPITGHWPGWCLVTDKPEDQYHREAFREKFRDGTYELVGPKIQGNPYGLDKHYLFKHGGNIIFDVPRDFEGLKQYFSIHIIEGIVWHRKNGDMIKIKRKDFGYEWPDI